MRNHSYENDFDLHENETACTTHFHIKGFALRLVLKQRHKRTRKWPIQTRRHSGGDEGECRCIIKQTEHMMMKLDNFLSGNSKMSVE